MVMEMEKTLPDTRCKNPSCQHYASDHIVPKGRGAIRGCKTCDCRSFQRESGMDLFRSPPSTAPMGGATARSSKAD